MAMTSASLARQLGSLFEDGSLAGLSDRQLIERFLARRDDSAEAAFAALVARHGPMVLGVCRQLLGDHHHAEDAFQAAFLVLARKARSLRDPDRLATWMYGVALRTARKARTRLARRRRHEEGDIMDPDHRADRPARRSGAARPRPGRGPARRDRPPAGGLPLAGRPLLLRGPDARPGRRFASAARPGRSAAGWPGRARSSAAP